MPLQPTITGGRARRDATGDDRWRDAVLEWWHRPERAVMVHHVATAGTAEIVLAQRPGESRMTPVLRYTGITGTEHSVEFSTRDVVSLMDSLVRMFEADDVTVRQWWDRLQTAQR